MSRALLVLALLVPVGACASAQAKPPVESVSLEVPPVPPRSIDRAPVEPPPIPLVEELELAPAPPVPAKPRAPARDTVRSEPKTDPKPDVQETDPAPPPQPSPLGPLRTQASAIGPEADRQIREMLDRANRLLETVDLRGMSEDRRAAFDGAKDSITRAYDALKAFNVVLARSLAERAENFARLFTGRELPH